MTPLCHWPSCRLPVAPRLWGCSDHWLTLPKELRGAIWETYRPGQEERKDPSNQYLLVAEMVQVWAKKYEEESTVMLRATAPSSSTQLLVNELFKRTEHLPERGCSLCNMILSDLEENGQLTDYPLDSTGGAIFPRTGKVKHLWVEGILSKLLLSATNSC